VLFRQRGRCRDEYDPSTVRRLFFATLSLLCACGSETPASHPADPKPHADGGTTGCAPGERPFDGGRCQPAGVPPESCGEGFQPDGAAGCDPILPPAPCPAGKMAIPGETACREIAPCAAGTWGDIPVDDKTQYVDATYAGMDSDGTKDKPWTTIADAVTAAAEANTLIAIAAGTYAEDIRVTSPPVRFWGVCPGLAEVVGSTAGIATFDIRNGGSATEIHALSITGAEVGIFPSSRVHVNSAPSSFSLDLVS